MNEQDGGLVVGVARLLLENLDGCCSQTETFDDGGDVGQVTQDGALLDCWWHHYGIPGQ